jgi:signal transduction histidine kinase
MDALRPQGSAATGIAAPDDGIEPGVLRVFRIFVALECLVFSLPLLAVRRMLAAPNYFALLIWLQSVVLLVYLLWPWPRRVLGRAYLPIALAVASLGPILSQALATALRLRDGIPSERALIELSGLYAWLLLPLLLISVQYGVRALLLFTIGTSVLSTLLGLLFFRAGGGITQSIVANAGLRLFLFTLAGLIVAQLAGAQRGLRAELARKNERLARYAATLEQLAASRERNRVARELHDTLAHTLSALSVQLNALDVQLETDPAAARQTLRQSQQLASGGLHEARRALHALRATPLEQHGLLGALRQTAERAAADAGAALALDLPPQLDDVRPEDEQHLFRIADEALQNVVRHARARHLSLTVAVRDGRLVLRVADDGVGFDAQAGANGGHYGLVGMRERAELLGGALLVHSANGQGTVVEVSIPHPRGRP